MSLPRVAGVFSPRRSALTTGKSNGRIRNRNVLMVARVAIPPGAGAWWRTRSALKYQGPDQERIKVRPAGRRPAGHREFDIVERCEFLWFATRLNEVTPCPPRA